MKVLCAVDGSEFSHWGTEALAALVEHPPKTLVLVHVLDIGPLKASGKRGGVSMSRPLARLKQEGARLLGEYDQVARLALKQRATAPITGIEKALVQGPVANTLVSQAKRRRADLLIVGSRGLSDLRGFLLGSVSRKVVSHSPCPVLVIKERLPQNPRILLAVDSSKYSKSAAGFLRRHVAGTASRVTVLSVVPPIATDIAARVLETSEIDRLMKPATEGARVLVAGYRESFLKDGYAVTTEVLSGHPSQSILDYVQTSKPDLVVMGSRGLAGNERLQLGSVSESVVKYAPCSVLVVKGRHV